MHRTESGKIPDVKRVLSSGHIPLLASMYDDVRGVQVSPAIQK